MLGVYKPTIQIILRPRVMLEVPSRSSGAPLRGVVTTAWSVVLLVLFGVLKTLAQAFCLGQMLGAL